MRTAWLTLALFACSALGACATGGGVRGAGEGSDESGGGDTLGAYRPLDERDARVAASDLVSVIMQLPALSPFATTIQISPPTSVLGEALDEALRDGGFGIQRVDDDQGSRYVSYRTDRTESDAGASMRLLAAVGSVAVERDYRRTASGALFPVSPVRVRGHEPALVIVNDDVYLAQAGEGAFPSGVVFFDDAGEEVSRRARTLTASSGRTVQDFDVGRELVLARSTLFLADRLQQEAIPDETLAPIAQAVLPFPHPSDLVLGERNKLAISRLLERYEPPRDRFTLTGCSHGKSLLWDGTESAALARSQRVKEELMLAGVASQDVLEEGCFAERFSDKLPRHGVVVTLERRLVGV